MRNKAFRIRVKGRATYEYKNNTLYKVDEKKDKNNKIKKSYMIFKGGSLLETIKYIKKAESLKLKDINISRLDEKGNIQKRVKKAQRQNR